MPIRSVLIAPSAALNTYERAVEANADAVLIDLCGRTPLAHTAALNNAAELLASKGVSAGPQIWIGVSPLDTHELARELSTLCALRPGAFVLPATETAADVEHLGAMLAVEEAKAGLPDGASRIVAKIESAASVFAIHAIARAGHRLAALGWNGETLARDLGADDDREIDGRWTDPLQTVRTLMLAACADARILAIDSLFTDADPDIFRREGERARRDGFGAKFAMTAGQAAIVNQAFAERT